MVRHQSGRCGSCAFPVQRKRKTQYRREMHSFHSAPLLYQVRRSIFFLRCLLCSYVRDPLICLNRDSRGREYMNAVNSAAVGMFAAPSEGRGCEHFNSGARESGLGLAGRICRSCTIKKKLRNFRVYKQNPTKMK